MSIEDKIELNYKLALIKYEMRLEMLDLERRMFVSNNPDFPPELLKIMFLNVTSPPQKVIIKHIK